MRRGEKIKYQTIIMQRAIIVGASSGIGLALAEILLQKNFCTGITARRENLLKKFQQQSPEKIEIAAFDITQKDATVYLDELVNKMDGLDYLSSAQVLEKKMIILISILNRR